MPDTKTQQPQIPAGGDALTQLLAQAIVPLIPPAVSEEKVAALVTAEVKSQMQKVKPLIVATPKGEPKDLGLTHKNLEPLIRRIAQHEHGMLVGPAGGGKTHAGGQVSQALSAIHDIDIPFSAISVNPMMSKLDIVGYMTADGSYVSTEFRECFEKGGLFMADEVDKANAGLLPILNMFLDGSEIGYFPDGPVKKHPHFYCMAGANTWGRGADRVYVGSQMQDGATYDRFFQMAWDYDEELERALSGDDKWVDFVQAVRRVIFKLSIHHVVSPRASRMGAKFLAIGDKWKDVEEICIWKGLSKDLRTKIEEGLPEGLYRGK